MRIFATICAAAIAVCGLLNAQTTPDSVSVRFATPVVIGAKTIPAGACTIRILRSSSDNVMLAVRSESGATSNVLVSRTYPQAVDPKGGATVVLSRHGDDLHFQRLVLPDRTGFSVVTEGE